MRIKEIVIKNYKGIESLCTNFNKGINLIIGNNGAGKTSLLSALSVILCEPLQMIRNNNNHNMINNDVRVTTQEIGDSAINTISNYPVEIHATFDYRGKEYPCSKTRTNEASNESSGNTGLWAAFLDGFNTDGVAPIICYMSAERTSISEGWNNNAIPTGETEKVQGYQDALSKHFNFDTIQQWCLKMEFAEYQKKQEIREYTMFKSIVATFMKRVDKNAVNPKIYYSSDAGALVYSDGRDDHTFDRLSAGYHSVLFMISELAYRAVVLNPLTENLIDVISGIVLIDEIDYHLHPAWQWKILPALKETFPKVQFIVATHSPIVLSSAKDASLMLMTSPNNIERIQSVYGYNIDDVLSLPQGTLDAPEEVTAYYDRAEAILDRGNEDELEQLVENAENDFKDYPEIVRNLKEFIDINKWVEEA